MNESYQLVDGPKLLETLFAEGCRPSLRWLQEQKARRAIPFVRIGRLVFYSPEAVRQALERRTFRAGGGQ